jgi:hypothetical protein
MTITILVIIILCFVVGLYIGSVIFGKEVPEGVFSSQKKVEALDQQLKDAPMVIECQLGQPLTVDQMAMDVVGPNLIKIWRHFGKPLYNVPSSSKVAEEMLQWYNQDSEYTKLVIVGWLRDGVVRIAWTWQQKDPKYIITKDAVEGLEKYYEDALGNPMVLGNQEV